MSSPLLRRAPFADLTPFEVYGLCRLRVDVFVVEQECPYPELDGRDVEPATWHLWFADESAEEDRKSTRLNSSHANISYAVFCLKKKQKNKLTSPQRQQPLVGPIRQPW